MARQGRKGGGSHGLIASLWSSVQKRSYFSLSDRRAFFMFFPEELITYAVYSNPADFCQGKKTPERWLQLILFREGGCLVKNGSKALKPRPWLLQGPLDLHGCACIGEHEGVKAGKHYYVCTMTFSVKKKISIRICVQSISCIYACAHMHHVHGGFVHLSTRAETFLPVPNYSAVREGLSNTSMCWIWELEAECKVRAASFKMNVKIKSPVPCHLLYVRSHIETWLTIPAQELLQWHWLSCELLFWGKNCLYMISIIRLDFFLDVESRSEKYYLCMSSPCCCYSWILQLWPFEAFAVIPVFH